MKLMHADDAGRNGLMEHATPPALLNEEPMNPNTNKKIKLMVVDDDPLVRKGIILCLAHSNDIHVVGELGDPRNVVAKTRELQPDVVLMDIGMPQMSGLVATCLLHEEFPEIKVLILSIHDNPEHLRKAIAAGARGYALKGTSADDLVHAVETVYQGQAYFSPEMMRVTLDQFLKGDQTTDKPRLTEREREVLVLVAEGRSNKETASELGVSVRTIETHRENLMRKLGIRSAAGLTRFAVANGFVSAGACA